MLQCCFLVNSIQEWKYISPFKFPIKYFNSNKVFIISESKERLFFESFVCTNFVFFWRYNLNNVRLTAHLKNIKSQYQF